MKIASFLLLTFCLIASSAHATEVTSPVTINTTVRLQGLWQDNTDLNATFSEGEAAAAELQVDATALLKRDLLFYWEGRAVGVIGNGDVEDVHTGTLASRGQSFLEWRQSYLEWNTNFHVPLQLRGGRQRIIEDYGLWWNDNFDALKFSYTSTLFSGFMAGGEDVFKYSTADADFRENKKNLARFLIEGSWQYRYQNFIEARALLLDDHSELSPIGTLQRTSDADSIEGTSFWFGLRATGKQHAPVAGDGRIAYRFDVIGLTGNNTVNVLAPSGGGLNTVTARQNVETAAFALDGAVDIPFLLTTNRAPLLHLGYAYGSGDNNPANTSNRAYQETGLNGDTSRLGLLSEKTHNYGTVLRPDLSNLHIFTIGVTKTVLTASDIGFFYRYYRLDKPSPFLPSSSVQATLNGVDKDLGQGIDLLFNANLLQETNLNLGALNTFDFRTSLGTFRSGQAFGTNSGEFSWRAISEVRLRF